MHVCSAPTAVRCRDVRRLVASGRGGGRKGGREGRARRIDGELANALEVYLKQSQSRGYGVILPHLSSFDRPRRDMLMLSYPLTAA
jgi:hypothetical protein